MEEPISLSTDKSLSKEICTEENLLAANEDLLEFASSPDEKLPNDESTLQEITSESKKLHTPHGLKQWIDIKDNEGTRWTDCNDSCNHSVSKTPLPLFLWTDSKGIWAIMMHKAALTSQKRNARLFEDSLTIAPRMRAILVEWIMEVCHVYHLRRTTFCYAVDYIDRYLSVEPNIPKTQLQLLGITALYIAAKFEEITPPKISEFAYVCDGVCTEGDIMDFERLLLNTLSWDMNPMTPTAWLNLYMQIHFDNRTTLHHETEENEASEFFLYPQYSAYDFVKASHLIDLFSMDPCYLLFSYNVIAASAMYYLYGRGCALKVSALQWKDIESCIEYMAVFYTVIRNTDDPKLDSFPSSAPLDKRDHATFNFLKYRISSITYGEYHAMQTLCVGLDYLERASILRIRRMGFRVTKKNISQSVINLPNEENPQNNQDVTEEPVEPSIVTFEIERDCSLNIAALNPSVSDIDQSKHESDTVFFDCKSCFTFDELLEGISICTINKFLVPKSVTDSND